MTDPDPRRPLDEQMLADWAAVGLRRLEAHLARHAEFCDFLRERPRQSDDREESCPGPHAP
jgi:hypothetical protein